ncbi:MAG: Rpn family recombination-promoting nuclease/putative transposase [Ruminococcus sp.]|nr:Rpn family recombination-promoting nuclease/putative transposase [Ruminococcus sp.]
MDMPNETAKQFDRRYLERLEKLRPIDDDFMRELFRNNIPLVQLVLRIITNIADLTVISAETQYDLKNLSGRSLILDILASDTQNRKYNIEIQRSDGGSDAKRARYHASAMDVEFLGKSRDFGELTPAYVIFITENDVHKINKPIYHFQNYDAENNIFLGDEKHIIYVNGAYNNPGDSSDLAKLIHDFNCCRADDMELELMSASTQYYKEKTEGVSNMCRIMEEIREEGIEKGIEKGIEEGIEKSSVSIAVELLSLGELSVEKIAKVTKLPIERIEQLAKQTPVTV